MMPTSKKPSIQTTSPTGWWIAALLERNPPGGSAAYWNNYRLVRAHGWREAFRRAVEMGTSDARIGNEGFGDGHEFIGVTDLVPVYDELEDGAEILFEEYDGLDGDPSKSPLEIFTEDQMAVVQEGAAQTDASTA